MASFPQDALPPNDTVMASWEAEHLSDNCQATRIPRLRKWYLFLAQNSFKKLDSIISNGSSKRHANRTVGCCSPCNR